MDFGKTALKWLGWSEEDAKTIRERRQDTIQRGLAAKDRPDPTPTSPARSFFQGLLGAEEPDRNLPSVMAGEGTPAQWMTRNSRESIERKQDSAFASGRGSGLFLDATDLGAAIKGMAAAGTLVRASAGQIKAATELLAKGASKEKVWSDVKAWKLPSGDWVTERTFSVDSIDTKRLPLSEKNAKPFNKVVSYETDMTPEEKEILNKIGVSQVAKRHGPEVAAIFSKEGDKGTMMIRPKSPDVAIDITHEIGHALRGEQNMPRPLGPEGLEVVYKTLDLRLRMAVMADDMLATPEGTRELLAGLAQLGNQNENVTLMRHFIQLSPEERMAEIEHMADLIRELQSTQGPLGFYISQQDEVLARLDEVRSPWTDAGQRREHPEVTMQNSIMNPVDPKDINARDWYGVLERLMIPGNVRTPRIDPDLFEDTLKPTIK